MLDKPSQMNATHGIISQINRVELLLTNPLQLLSPQLLF